MNSPKEVAQNYIATGVAKTKLPIAKMLVLGVLAGMFIALAGVGATIASATVASASIGKLIGASVFPAGLAMVLVAGSELFTGNCLLIIPVLEKEAKLRAMLKNWVFVYIGNFIGSILVSVLTVYGGTFSLFSNAAAATALKTAVAKVGMGFGDALFRGILCNFLVCIAVWMAFAAKDIVGKIAGLFLPIMLFVLSGYEHSIANMYYIPTGLFISKNANYLAAFTDAGGGNLDALTWGTFLTKNLIPVTLGNIIGGMVLVGIFYWFIYLRNAGEKAPASGSGVKKKKR
ncbi:MAG: formate/nitrite transporter family protein [Oscillospiraceae bacterium]|jgi:formate/nitrite transporter|nr:formate/nitrite transporter family protein [Oscillospiraceae bacterium]